MDVNNVFLGLGGNIGDTSSIIRSAMAQISALPKVADFISSPLYKTSPLCDLPQPYYVNAVCSFKTSWSARELLNLLQNIETLFGKKAKPKNAPRSLDIDILFFGLEYHQSPDLDIPHPRWRERLFVLVPLSDLTPEIFIPNPTDPLRPQKIKLKPLIQSISDTQTVERL